MSLAPRFNIQKFWSKIVVNPNDPNDIREEDWVSYGPLGMSDRSLTGARVSALRAVSPGDMSNPAIRAAAMRWSVVEPLYNAWKAGREAPIDGTPLAVLNSIEQEPADYLRGKGIKTIEELAELTDTHIERMKISGLRTYIADAKRWLEASDSRRVTATLAEKDKEIANQQLQLTDQQEQISALMRRMDDLINSQVEAKRGPGRPRKEPEAPEMAEAPEPTRQQLVEDALAREAKRHER